MTTALGLLVLVYTFGTYYVVNLVSIADYFDMGVKEVLVAAYLPSVYAELEARSSRIIELEDLT